jgi:murein L,D-transpeptidase YcbB/YkuD
MSLVACTAGTAAAQSQRNTEIQASLPAAQKSLSKAALSHGALQGLQQLYAGPGTLLWSVDGRPTGQARALVAEFTAAESYGLRTQDYGAQPLEESLAALTAARTAAEPQLVQFDVRLSAAALHFLSDLHFGRVSPAAAGFKLQEAREPFDLALALQGLATAHDVPAALSGAEPPFFHYKLLKDALAHYHKLALQAPLPALPPIKASIKPGDTYAGAPALREVLERLEDLPPGSGGRATDLTYDTHLSAGVAHFQNRHGLKADGTLGKSTLAALQAPLERRIRQISLTLERWRWLRPFKTPPLIVNIPQFRLFAFRTTEDRAADILQMKVIVGRAYANTQTPVFEGAMTYVVLRPYWDIPRSILRNEMLPKIRANPGYLTAQRLELVDGQSDSSPVVPPTPENIEALAAGQLRIRQQPGEDNALGLAKFMFPNSYNVYLHSTPAHNLFKESARAFSHGCIRVADPLGLALLVLKNAEGDWSREKIEAAMNGASSQRVQLKQSIDVLILYGTALATEDGPVFFFEDIYGYDRKLEQQLALAPVRH